MAGLVLFLNVAFFWLLHEVSELWLIRTHKCLPVLCDIQEALSLFFSSSQSFFGSVLCPYSLSLLYTCPDWYSARNSRRLHYACLKLFLCGNSSLVLCPINPSCLSFPNLPSFPSQFCENAGLCMIFFSLNYIMWKVLPHTKLG